MRFRNLSIGATGLVLTFVVGSLAIGPAGWPSWLQADSKADGPTGLLEGVLSAVSGSEASGHVHLRVPGHEPLLVPATPQAVPSLPAGARRAQAYQYTSRIFHRPHKRPIAIGYVRRGTVLHPLDRVPGPGCRGSWYALEPRGVICDRDGFEVAREPRTQIEQRQPDTSRALPFRYAKVRSPEALRFYRLPNQREEAEIEAAVREGRSLPEVVEQPMNGVRLLALDSREHIDQRVFMRTVRGRYVRLADLEEKHEPRMRGVRLRGERKLPYAFVYQAQGGTAPVYRLERDALSLAGVADYHARMPVLRELTVDGREFVLGPEKLALARKRVRVARAIPRPSGIGRKQKWIHVDLAEQVLVAYEGERPVFATLVSSGKGEAHATPTGLYRVREKHISTTMSGPDPEHGVYEVEEVPWTLFYQDSYALHGAYWHDEFGVTRSHGCTNISPVDARWLFYWSDGVVPPGWNAVRGITGTWVYITDGGRSAG